MVKFIGTSMSRHIWRSRLSFKNSPNLKIKRIHGAVWNAVSCDTLGLTCWWGAAPGRRSWRQWVSPGILSAGLACPRRKTKRGGYQVIGWVYEIKGTGDIRVWTWRVTSAPCRWSRCWPCWRGGGGSPGRSCSSWWPGPRPRQGPRLGRGAGRARAHSWLGSVVTGHWSLPLLCSEGCLYLYPCSGDHRLNVPVWRSLSVHKHVAMPTLLAVTEHHGYLLLLFTVWMLLKGYISSYGSLYNIVLYQYLEGYINLKLFIQNF